MKKMWYCKIGEVDNQALSGSPDGAMRSAVAEAYRRITYQEPTFLLSGWGAELTESERAVVEDREPDIHAQAADFAAASSVIFPELVKHGLASGADLIAHERLRQEDEEGHTREDDRAYTEGELRAAAISYASDPGNGDRVPWRWPWLNQSWKPSDDPIRDLVKAGALIAAEIDRLAFEKAETQALERARDEAALKALKEAITALSDLITYGDNGRIDAWIRDLSDRQVLIRRRLESC